MLAVVVGLDALTLAGGVRPLLKEARQRHLPLARYLWRGTDPAVTTVVLSSTAGVGGGIVAAAGLLARELTGAPATDAVASAVIGLILLATSVVLLHNNRELLTGRGVSPAQAATMRHLVAGQPGVVAVPDLFAIVVGPSSLIVDADVVFEDGLDVPQVEDIIVNTATALRAHWPAVAYVYLNPVARKRSRRFAAHSGQPPEQVPQAAVTPRRVPTGGP